MNYIELLFRRIVTYLKILLFKVRYGAKLNVQFPQRDWEHKSGLIIKGDKSSVKIGKSCNFRQLLTLRALNGGSIEFGSGCFCNSNVNITSMERVKIGNDVKIANNVVIIDHDHDYRNNNVGYVTAPVRIGNKVWIGANAVILKGVTIGDHSVIAAGSIVNHDIPDHCVAAGIPAKVIKEYSDEA